MDSGSIDLEPVIHRLLGLVIVKSKVLRPETENMNEENDAMDEEMEEEKE
jgi:hypothetical protein